MFVTATFASVAVWSTFSTSLLSDSANALASAPPVAAVLRPRPIEPSAPPVPVIPFSSMGIYWTLATEFECLGDHLLDETDRGEIGLIGTRRAHHVHHFRGGIDVRQRDEAVLVRVRMRRFVAAAERCLVLHDARDLDPRRAGLAEHAIEADDRVFRQDDVAAAVRLAIDAARRLGIGDVGHRDLDACALDAKGAGARRN